MLKISASVLNSDLTHLSREVERVEAAGADMLHIDVMDGVFVPPITIGDVVVKKLRGKSGLVFDTHLMVIRPDAAVEFFAKAGSDIITVHEECACDKFRLLKRIKELGVKAGLSLCPGTEVEKAYPYIGLADMFLIMTVNPGYGGQEFIRDTLPKITALKKETERRGIIADIEVDGGINEKTAPEVIGAGANVLVAGTYLFNAPDMREAVGRLQNCV